MAFDVGGVLRRAGPVRDFEKAWQERLGMTQAEFGRALASVDPDGLAFTGHMSLTQFKARHSIALGLSAAAADEFMAEMWAMSDGEIDAELAAYAASLRPRYCTAILSDAIDGRATSTKRGPGSSSQWTSSTPAKLAWPSPTRGSTGCCATSLPSRPERSSSLMTAPRTSKGPVNSAQNACHHQAWWLKHPGEVDRCTT